MNEHGLTLFDLTKKDFHLKLKKGADLDDLRSLLAACPPPGPAYARRRRRPGRRRFRPGRRSRRRRRGNHLADGRHLLPQTRARTPRTSSKSAPPSPIGQTLCIIEAMKVMNEIKAENSGTICAVVAEDGTPVQFGDVLFRIK